MSTFIRADEAAAMLDVTKPTLYAYVSRGRLNRRTGPDGRESLFARDEVEQLAARSRRTPSGPPPTIDVQISSAVTVIDDSSLHYRGHDVVALAAHHNFEDVAELLWTTAPVTALTGVRWPASAPADRAVLASIDSMAVPPISRLAVAAHALAAAHPDERPADSARRLLLAAPHVLGSKRSTGRYAMRLTEAWRRRPNPALADAVDTALVLLADHELATSTLAVRIAASVRAPAYVAFAAGLATTEGALHGSASAAVHHFLADCAAGEPSAVIGRLRSQRRTIPGFGHKVYRSVDPRFPPLMERVRELDPEGADLVDAVVGEAGRVMSHPPNVDLALGALTWAAGLEPTAPIFAVARIAGWAAHYAEEVDERPVRFRGVARPRR